MEIVERENTHAVLADKVKRLIRVGEELPEMVLQSRLSSIGFFEFDEIFTDECWQAITRLRETIQDESDIFICPIKPDAAHFLKFWSNYGDLIYPGIEQRSALWDAQFDQPDKYPQDEMILCMNQLVVSSMDERWAIWADRDLGVALIGVMQDVLKKNEILGFFEAVEISIVTAETAAKNFIANNFAHQVLPEGFEEKIRVAYGS